MRSTIISSIVLFTLLISCTNSEPSAPLKDYPKWSKVVLDFAGPESSEQATDNPFLNYTLRVKFTHQDSTIDLRGYYAADGNAAETSADTGQVWRVIFRPPLEGVWSYDAKLYHGEQIIYAEVNTLSQSEVSLAENGQFNITPPASGEKGRLVRGHDRYLRWTETGTYFLKGGADSPENFLGYIDFDSTYRYSATDRDGESKTEGLHRFTAHEQDFRPGDPSWQDGKGRGIIGALNYLADKGMNSVYFLTLNINGDGKDVWPYTHHEERYRFDCSKLDQWEIVFDHMESLGLMLHIVTQETENEKLHDGGDTGPERQIYYQELVARFGHHPAITWNLGEENGPADFTPDGQSKEQQEAMAAWFTANDPYNQFLVIHTHSNEHPRELVTKPLLGNQDLDGLSFQIDKPYNSHAETKNWLAASQAAGHPWIICLDEIGPWWRGIDHDAHAPYNNQDSIRSLVLWGNLMAGGGGAEWYFGAFNPHNDLGCEDWRSRDQVWTWTAHALNFFQQYLPFHEMESHDELLTDEAQFCFAKKDATYAIFLPYGGTAELDLRDATGRFTVSWYNPRTGGTLQAGSVTTIDAGEKVSLGNPPDSPSEDWAILVSR